MSRVQTITFPVLLAVAAGTCVALGVWQLTRLADRRAANARAMALREQPPVNLAEPNRPELLVNRRVVADGAFDAARSFILRQRPQRGFPGVQVVTPLRLDGSDTAVLVNLGHVPTVDAVTVDRSMLEIPAGGPVSGLAVAMADSRDLAQPLVRGGDTTWRHLVYEVASSRLPYPILPVVVLRGELDSAGGFPRPIPYPALDDGPHLSYAIQWFAFAVIALVGGGLWLKKRRETT